MSTHLAERACSDLVAVNRIRGTRFSLGARHSLYNGSQFGVGIHPFAGALPRARKAVAGRRRYEILPHRPGKDALENGENSVGVDYVPFRADRVHERADVTSRDFSWHDPAQHREHIGSEHALVLGECAVRECLAPLHPVTPARGFNVPGGQLGFRRGFTGTKLENLAATP